MSEQATPSRHSQLKYRLRTRIPEDLFDAMPENVQDFLLNIAQEDIREGQLTTILNLPWKTRNTLPPVNLSLAKSTLDRSHYAMTGVKEKVIIHCKKAGFCLDVKTNTFTCVPSLKLPKELIKGSVGAGDAFCAGCLYAIYNGYDDQEMLAFANLVAVN